MKFYYCEDCGKIFKANEDQIYTHARCKDCIEKLHYMSEEECDECGEFKPKFQVLFDDEEYETYYVCEECYKKYEKLWQKYNKRFE